MIRSAALVAGVLLGASAASPRPLKFDSDSTRVFEHALFIRGDGHPADLVDGAGHPIDFASRFASRPERPPKELRAVLDSLHDARSHSHEVCRTMSPNFDYTAYLACLTQAMRNSLGPSKKHHVLLWIHGGRNPLAGGPKRTLRLVSALDSTEYYPICVNWESGDLAAYGSHLIYARPARTNLVERGWRVLKLPFLIVHDIGCGIARTPLGIYGDASREGSALASRRDSLARTEDSLVYSRGAMRKGVGRYLHPLVWLVSLPTRATFSVIIHAGGPGEWESLLHSTQEMFQTDADLCETDVPLAPMDDSGAMSQFVDAFEATLEAINKKARSARDSVDVTIIAHSMGAIVACEMLRHHGNLPVHDVVFIAAACRVHDFFDVVVPTLEHHPSARFFNVMLHPVNDLQDTFAPIAGEFFYRGSLLTWIDDFLSTHESPLERTLGRSENALAATRLVPTGVRSRVKFKTFGDGKRGDPSAWRYGTPRHHGDFNSPRFRFWEEGFWTPVTGDSTAKIRPRRASGRR